jgi:hypothetical protein
MSSGTLHHVASEKLPVTDVSDVLTVFIIRVSQKTAILINYFSLYFVTMLNVFSCFSN